MSFEKPYNENDNVVDFNTAREQRRKKPDTHQINEISEAENGESVLEFTQVFSQYGERFGKLNREFEKILDDPQIAEIDKVIVRRQVAMNTFEITRLLHVTARYQSHEEYAKKIERMLELLRATQGEVKGRANQSLKNMQIQLDEFAAVFRDYGLKEEEHKVEILKQKILKGFLEG